MDKYFIGAFIVCVVTGAIGMALVVNGYFDNLKYENFVKLQIENRYPISEATFHSPSVVIRTYNVNEFLSKAAEVNASIIYQTYTEGYVAVDSDFKIAYNLEDTLHINIWGLILIIISLICEIIVILLKVIAVSVC